MATWKYDVEDNDPYLFKQGDIIKIGDVATVAVADIEKGDIPKFIRKVKISPTVVYSDPPWNAGNATSFRTKAGLPRKVVFMEGFMKQFLKGVKYKKVFIEMGFQKVKEVEDLIKEAGGVVYKTYEVKYYKKHESRLIWCGWGVNSVQEKIDLTGYDDNDLPTIVIQHYTDKNDVIFDPCTGVEACTPLAAISAGRYYLGTELSPYRLCRSIHEIVKKSGGEVKKIGNLYQ